MAIRKFPSIINTKCEKTIVKKLDSNLFSIVKEIFSIDNEDDDISIIKIYNLKTKVIKLKYNGNIKYAMILNEDKEYINSETISNFIKALVGYGLDKDSIKRFLFFHWADMSYDNTGKTRVSIRKMYDDYPEELNKLNEALNNSKIKCWLLNKYFFHMNKVPVKIDYIIYKNDKEYKVLAKAKALELLNTGSSRNDSIHIGPLNIHTVKRNITRISGIESQRKRINFIIYNYRSILK